MKTVKTKIQLLLAAAAAALAITAGCTSVFAEDTVSVQVTGKYGQTEAREMLQMINDFRTGSDAWYWNASNSEKIYSRNLQPLAYDYELEQVAMQRAMELAISFGHVRPIGGYVFSMYECNAAGENIAAGYGSAASVFKGWQETNEDYSGQGHRRNMLSSDFTAVGIGHVYCNGVHYWVQDFRSPTGTMEQTAANDSETPVTVEILSSAITQINLIPSVQSVSLSLEETTDLPKLTTKILTSETWGPRDGCPVDADYTWTATDDGCIRLQDGKIYGLQLGTTSVTTTVLGETISIPVTVTPKDISNAAVTWDAETFVYDGSAKELSGLTVVRSGVTLTKDTDYTVSYKNNTASGNASVTISGIGDYTGSITKSFTISEPKKNSSFKDEKTGSTWKVTKTGNSRTVTLVSPKNNKIKSMTIPATVSYGGVKYTVNAIAASAFKNCKSMAKVTVGKNITTIGKYAFYNCPKLKTITISSKVLKTVGSKAFGKIYSKATVKVPSSKLKAYQKLLKGKGLSSKAKIKK